MPAFRPSHIPHIELRIPTTGHSDARRVDDVGLVSPYAVERRSVPSSSVHLGHSGLGLMPPV